MVTSPQRKTDGRRDLFISHASEDKDFVGPLAGALSSQGLEIWYDEYELQIGDRVRDRIDHRGEDSYTVDSVSWFYLQNSLRSTGPSTSSTV